MKLIDMNLKDFADEVESLSPAPGGGSCSAYSSLVGICLSRMMANLSFGKKKYELNEENIKLEVKTSFEALKEIKDEMLSLVDKDTEAFNEVVKAMKMPKETDEEKALRKDAIDNATWQSIDVPHRVALLSLEAMKKMYPIYKYGNENALTDVGVGYLMCATGAEGAILNVKINLGSVMDIERAKKLELECNQLLSEVTNLKNEVLVSIHDRLKI
ncbi:Formiminotetrahydrofolate cyclodeaminase [Acetoanaerobium noterae]|uniref:Formiminotetrahydrofolate cyclodeaminase n=1 Tax=Acetoanaerobium noterae TaxID=745369 RepID=A0A1T5CMA3_9FIRM|nr:cyclodeaminase/cyclohydrolase family protein [Acetoanaerobium noterae]SKB60577.1 Formiminotetrahydrofolate cyclodeaminase [Acetoanaerobium noterae]